MWWADQCKAWKEQTEIELKRPYKKGPAKIGVFATRSVMRPNSIGITPVYVIESDFKNGLIYIPYIDAEPQPPILDIKPYHGSCDVVKDFTVPQWCNHWPKSIEDSADFPWENEFNF